MKEKIKAIKPFNPLDKKNLGISVAEALLETSPYKLPPNIFIGAGIYSIYYIGDFELYENIAEKNRNNKFNQPIYVGKAVPAGARKGGFGLGEDPGTVLFKRMKEHADSIDRAKNLDLNDFYCKYLVVDDIWIPLAESMLIEMFNPLWNKKIDGFGNHDPGKGRYNQKRSLWDTLHPGREWAYKLNESDYSDFEVFEKVQKYLDENS